MKCHDHLREKHILLESPDFDLLLREICAVIPSSLQQNVMMYTKNSVKTLARENVWFYKTHSLVKDA